LDLKQLIGLFKNSSTQNQLKKALSESRNIHLKGANGSSLSFCLSQLFENAKRPHLFIAKDKEEAAYYLNDLQALLGREQLLFYPSSYHRPYQIEEIDNANVLQRADVLNQLGQTKIPFIVTYPDAIFEKVVTKKAIEKCTQKIKVGDLLSVDFINEV